MLISMIIPDRLSVDKENLYYDELAIGAIEVYFNGIRQTTVHEYCISEGWIDRVVTSLGRVKHPKEISRHFGEVKVAWK